MGRLREMKIGMQTWGSHGDIIPFLALANGLKVAGHDVTLVYTSVENKDYSSLAGKLGISLIKARGRLDEVDSKLMANIIEVKDPLEELSLILENYFDPAVDEMYAMSRRLCRESDLVIGAAIHYPLAIAAEKSRCPRISVALCPMAVASKYISPFGGNLGKWINSLFWKLGDRLARKKVYRSADQLREQEGLPPFKDLQEELYIGKELTLIGACKPLCPRPPDWGDNIQICGFLNPPPITAEWEMPRELKRFLEDGEPPVYFTFGSCTPFDLDRTTRLFLEATKKSGTRAIIQSDWDKFQPASDDPDIYKVVAIPHEYIFPHCALIVHHGGSGTTQASLRAGKPSVVVAHAFDQPYWGGKLHQLEVAGKVLLRRTTNADKLAAGIRKVLAAPRLALNARKIGRGLSGENGVTNAVAMIEEKFK